MSSRRAGCRRLMLAAAHTRPVSPAHHHRSRWRAFVCVLGPEQRDQGSTRQRPCSGWGLPGSWAGRWAPRQQLRPTPRQQAPGATSRGLPTTSRRHPRPALRPASPAGLRSISSTSRGCKGCSRSSTTRSRRQRRRRAAQAIRQQAAPLPAQKGNRASRHPARSGRKLPG